MINSNYGGKNSELEKYYNSLMTDMTSKISGHTSNIQQILLETYNKPKLSAEYWSEAKRKINNEYNAIKRTYQKYAVSSIPKAYRHSMQDLFRQLNKDREVALLAKRSFNDLAFSASTSTITNALYKDALADVITALDAGQGELNKILRKTRQGLLNEARVNSSIIKAIEKGNLMKNTSYNLSSSLASQLQTLVVYTQSQAFVIVNGRKYTPEYYAELVTRTKFHEAQAYGAIATCKNYGTELVRVSSHNTETAICADYEGRIYSLGGTDSRFPPLDVVPPYHPNCLHLLFPVFESGLIADGTLQGMSEFSKGEIDRPPVPASFIPVGKRKLVG